jgi:hypothetical protein
MTICDAWKFVVEPPTDALKATIARMSAPQECVERPRLLTSPASPERDLLTALHRSRHSEP